VVTLSHLGLNWRHIGSGVGSTVLAHLEVPEDEVPEAVGFLPL